MKPECAKFDFGKCDGAGTVPGLGDLTIAEFSFAVKCPASRHLPVGRKTPPPCRGGGSKSRRGFPPTCHSARETKRPLWPPQGKQNGIMAAARETKGHYGRRKGNKRALWPPQGEQKGRYAPVGVRPPRPFGARPPARWDSSFHRNRDADFRIHKPVRAYTRQALVRARMWKAFFGLKILILN